MTVQSWKTARRRGAISSNAVRRPDRAAKLFSLLSTASRELPRRQREDDLRADCSNLGRMPAFEGAGQARPTVNSRNTAVSQPREAVESITVMTEPETVLAMSYLSTWTSMGAASPRTAPRRSRECRLVSSARSVIRLKRGAFEHHTDVFIRCDAGRPIQEFNHHRSSGYVCM
jgi:hypothetical protein